MKEKELLEKYGVSLREFDPCLWSRQGFYDPINKVIYINSALSQIERRKVLLHELGHLDHCPIYQHASTLCENQANRNMIHHLVQDAVATLDNVYDFNYKSFMDFYNLKTTTDEAMVKEEYLNFVSGL